MSQFDSFHVAFVVDVMYCSLFTFTMVEPDPIMQSRYWIIFNLIHEDVFEGRTADFPLSTWV